MIKMNEIGYGDKKKLPGLLVLIKINVKIKLSYRWRCPPAQNYHGTTVSVSASVRVVLVIYLKKKSFSKTISNLNIMFGCNLHIEKPKSHSNQT